MNVGEAGPTANREQTLAKQDLLKCQDRHWGRLFLAVWGQVLGVREAELLLISEIDCLLKGQAHEALLK